MIKKVAVGLSGGVDSSVVLLLLKQQGYQVTGVHMQCWDYNEEGCTGAQDKADAIAICSQLEVPFKFLDFQKEYQERVIQNFYDEYESGRTPNPDVLCNKEIKFGLFLDWALANGFDLVATGHYAKILKEEIPRLFIPKDTSKDQTYFLYRLKSQKLEKILFPLGNLLKEEVRDIAFNNNLKNFNKPESMGICFIGKINVRDFLKRRIKEKTGEVRDTSGALIGKHRGVPFYTIGQRHGFEIFKYTGKPLYIIEKDAKTNSLVVGDEVEALKLFFTVSEINFITEDFINLKLDILVRVRHLGQLHEANVSFGEGSAKVELKNPVFGIAPGQSCVFYTRDSQVLGGGIIN
jgi:tRNA-specific 2-thiouridylase